MKMLHLLFPVLAWSMTMAVSHADDWRAFRGNDGLATSPCKELPLTWSASENLLWKAALPGAGTSTPVVVGDRVFVTCFSGYNVPGREAGSQEDLRLHMVCLDRSSGKILWDREFAPSLPEQSSIRDRHGYASSSPTADDKRVFGFFGKSGVVAFDHAGKELWRGDVGSGRSGWGSGASLLLAGNLLIVNASVESETLYAFSADTGKVAWTLKGLKEAWNTPILTRHEGRTVLIIAIHGKILGIDPNSGTQRWSCATDIPWYMVPSMVAHDGVVYAIGGRPGGGLAVKLGGSGDVTATHRLWTSEKGGNVSSPVYHDGHLYWVHDNRETAFCAEAGTGRVVYEERINRCGQMYGSPVLANGRIYYPSRGGTIHVVAAEPEFELLASNTFGERGDHLSSPAVACDHLFIRTNQHLYCVGTK